MANTKTIRRVCVLMASLAAVLPGATAQTAPDTTDIYFRHLNLDEVTVTGLTGQSRLREMPAPVSVVTGRELHSSASTNIIDALSRQPGISQITTGSAISKPVVRGLGYNRVAVVSDGIRQEGQQWGDEHGVEIDAHAVGQVEVLKGPASLMYGSDAMAGVLIFQPYPLAPPKSVRASLSTGFQSNNGLLDYSVGLSGHEQGVVWDARWSQKLAHAYRNRADGRVPGSQMAEEAARMMVGLNKAWGHSHLILSYYHLLPSIIEGERDERSGALLNESGHGLKSYHRALPFQHVYHYKAVLDHSFHIGQGQLKALIGYQQNRRQEFEESEHDCGLYLLLHTLNYDVRYQHQWDSGWKLAAGAGGMYQRSANKGDDYLIPDYRLLDVGTFLTLSHRWRHGFLSGGVRWDHRRLLSHALEEDGEWRFQRFGRRFDGLSASLGAVWNITDRWNLRANLARGFRAPNMSELGSNGVHEGTLRYEVGNHLLHPEHSWQLDLGMDFSSKYLSAQVALFANWIDHYIYLHRTDADTPARYATYGYSSGDARLAGLELQLDFHPVHRLHIENTFGMVDARQRHQPRASRFLPLTPAPRWSAELKYEFTHEGNRLFDNTYAAFGMDCHLAQHHCYRADDTERPTPSYTLFRLEAGTDLRLKQRRVAALYLTVQNLFDRVYQNHLSRLKYADVNNQTGRQGVFNMGRNVCLRLVVPLSW